MIGTFLTGLEIFLTNYTPVILSIIGMISTYFVAIGKMKSTKDDTINDANEVYQDMKTEFSNWKKDIKSEMKEQNELCKKLVAENIELKKQNKELKELITHVRENDQTEGE